MQRSRAAGERFRPVSASVDRDQVLAQMGVVLDSVLRDHDVVLDPDPGATLEVDPRLDRDDVSRLQRVSRLAREPRDFVDVEPETVSETMSELPGELALVDDAPGGSVRVDAADPRSNRI